MNKKRYVITTSITKNPQATSMVCIVARTKSTLGRKGASPVKNATFAPLTVSYLVGFKEGKEGEGGTNQNKI